MTSPLTVDTGDTAEPTPIWKALIDDLGPLYDPVDTEYVVLAAQAVLALAERQPA